MRQTFVHVVLLALALSTFLYAAPPDIDPLGWDGVILGSSFEEVVKQLGNRARKRNQSSTETYPARLDHVEAAEARSLADRWLTLYRKDRSSVPSDIVEASRAMKKLLSPRKWTVNNRTFYAAVNAVGPYINIKLETRAGQVGSFRDDQFDTKSQEFFRDFSETATTLINYSRRLEAAEYDAADLDRIEGPDDLVVDKVQLNGITFTPKLTFSPKLSEIQLSSHFNSLQRSDVLQIFESICDATEEQFGSCDTATLDKDGRQRVWDFPKTVITLHYRKQTTDTLQYFNGQNQMRPSTTEHITITYSSR